MSHRPPTASSGAHDNPHRSGSRDWKDWNAEGERLRQRRQDEERASWDAVLQRSKPEPAPVYHQPSPPQTPPKASAPPAKMTDKKTGKKSETPWSTGWAFVGLVLGAVAGGAGQEEASTASVAFAAILGAGIFGRFYRVIFFVLVVVFMVWFFESMSEP